MGERSAAKDVRERMPREARRGAILDSATEVFATKGYEATRMEDVAQAAGIAKGLLYKHFPSKDALFEALIDRQGREYVAELRGALLAADPGARPEESLTSGLRVWFRQVGESGQMLVTDPGAHGAYERLRGRMREVIVDALVAAEPTADRTLAWLASAAVQGAAENVGLAWSERADEVDVETAVALLSAFCWAGLNAIRPDPTT